MAFVIDASVALAWHFRDEHWPAANSLAERAVREGLVAPPYFLIEIGNGLLRGERTKRTRQRDVEDFITRLGTLRVEVDDRPETDAFQRVLPLARAYGLKVFDAGYLHLAMVRDLPLATFDRGLENAARAAGVALLES